MLARISAVLLGLISAVLADDTVGQRPYEMVWANRTEDVRLALFDFENLDGWAIERVDAEASLSRSREQQLWGQYVGRLAYRGTGAKAAVTLKPPRPIPVAEAFDCINLWVYGNNWAWEPDRTTPPVEIAVLLRGGKGQELSVSLGQVRWKQWWLMHRRLSPEQIAALGEGVVLEGIRIAGGRNEEDRVLYLDNLTIYRESLPPLKFAPRPTRGIEPFHGQSCGTNTGPGRLPFPTREETILPDNLTPDFKTSLETVGDAFEFHYRGADGHLVYRYQPNSGTLSDVTARWDGRGATFQPLSGGGIRMAGKGGTGQTPEKIDRTACRRQENTVVSTWRCSLAGQACEVVYTLRLWQKSLVIDVRCLGGEIVEFSVGKAVGLPQPRLVTLPYLTGDQHRPAVLAAGPPEQPLFAMALLDYYRSNASSLFAVNQVAADGVAFNGGARYLPRTDRRRNDCFERLFLTVSPRFEEVLPNVPNPRSPWMQVAGERLWRAHSASNRQNDYELWKKFARYGMTKVVITDHETGWRDGGESFTFRTRAAPGKGGDEGQADYARKIRALGFRYGIYNNYTDYAPVNEHWNEDCVTRLSDGDWRRAWARCYNPKPARAVEFEARLAPMIQEKFHLDTAYCDVHTAVRPWDYVDYDVRVPGAGTFAATLYAYGEIMLHQKRIWDGPVYSEGNNHWYYCGLTDGNYGQDQAARLDENPWLVDFDLRKLHPLCCNFGMGNLEMFYGSHKGLGKTPAERGARLDRFLAATLAFGHTGFLVTEGGLPNTVRSYFTVQQIHARYAQETVASIRYADAEGHLLDTSAAVATGVFQRSQIVTEYANGLKVTVNGHPRETWKTPDAELPPNGWFAKDGKGELTAFSALVDGRRVDYVDSPAYLYADGRGQQSRFAKAACDGPMIAHKRSDGTLDVVPVDGCRTFAVSLGGRTGTAMALAEDGKELGPAETRLARGLLHIMAVPRAFSYHVKPGEVPAVSLRCGRESVVPGETVTVVGSREHTLHVPPDAVPGTPLWQQFEGGWIDFRIVPLVGVALHLDGTLHLELRPHLPAPADAQIQLGHESQQVRLTPSQPALLRFNGERPTQEGIRELRLSVAAGALHYGRSWWLKAEDGVLPLAAFSESVRKGLRLRKAAEEPLNDQTGAIVDWRTTSCGGVERHCLFMHPPYRKGVGYAFALSGPIDLPAQPCAAFRCEIGKADGSDRGDGILFRVAIMGPDGSESVVAEKTCVEHAWAPLEADLSSFAGKPVRLKLIADVGPADNSSGDWACWAAVRIESLRPALGVSLHESRVELQRQPGPLAPPKLARDQLRQAKSAVLHFQGIGLQNDAKYASRASLNGVRLGPLPAAGGNEREGTWSDARLPLPAEAVAALDEWNRLVIENPAADCFKVRSFWIELLLPDGQRCSSQITTAVYTQPPEWPCAEGTVIPFGKPIEIAVRIH